MCWLFGFASLQDAAATAPPRPRGRPRNAPPLWTAPLYSGCTATVGEACESLLSIQANCKLSQAAMSQVFDLFSKLLPSGHALPIYRVAKDILTMNDGGVQLFHACVNDCIVYGHNSHLKMRDYRNDSVCPVCGADRLRPDGLPHKVGDTTNSARQSTPS